MLVDLHLINYARLTNLRLSGCIQLTKLQPCFGNIPYLNFCRCSNLEDISALGKRNIEVDLSYCSKINDVSNLSAVKRLNISYCEEVKSISDLTSVKWLTMKRCKQVLTFGNLDHSNSLRFLDISGCDTLKDLILRYNTVFPSKVKVLI
jgi:hypothetical protein